MTQPSHYDSVLEFYRKFQLNEYISDRTGLDESVISTERLHLKLGLIAEEFFELVEAVYGKVSAGILENAWTKAKLNDQWNRDIVETADALTDLIYVIHNLAIETGIPMNEVFEEVHSSNMSKLGADGNPVISDGVTPSEYDGEVKPKGKVVKGPNFREPDIAKILGI